MGRGPPNKAFRGELIFEDIGEASIGARQKWPGQLFSEKAIFEC